MAAERSEPFGDTLPAPSSAGDGERERADSARPSLGDVATVGLFVLLGLASIERGLFFSSNRLPFEALIALLAAVAAVERGVRGEGPLWLRGMDWAVFAMTVGYLIAWRAHPAAPGPARDRAALALAFLLWYWSAAHLLRGARRIRLAGALIFASGVVLSLVGALAADGLLRFPYAILYDRILSTLQYPNALAIWIVVAFTAGVAHMVTLLSRPASRFGQWWLGLCGAGAAVMVLVLVGTYSRAGWLVMLLALAVWLYGLPPQARRDGAVVAGWPVLVGVLLSRAFLSVLHQATPPSGAAVAISVSALCVAALLGGGGIPAYRVLRRALRRQRWSPALRRALQVGLASYAAILVWILLAAARHSVQVAGQGVLGSTLAGRINSIGSTGGSSSTRFMLWWDAWRMIRRRPVLGYGGGGWAALYHQFQHMGYSISLVHSSFLQAWVDGGMLACLGLVGVGVLLFRRGWRLRLTSEGMLLWGVAVGGCALWVHALIDFDLSIPAVMLLLITIAGCLRGAGRTSSAAPTGRGWVATGLVVTGVCSAVLLLYSQHFSLAGRLGAFASSQIDNHQYALAYQAGAEAAGLDPLSAPDQASLAELLAAAYSVNGVASERQQALSAGRSALRLDQGDLPSQVAMLGVALSLQDWSSLQAWSDEVLNRFPVDPTAYQRVAAALTTAADTLLQSGQGGDARSALKVIANLPNTYRLAGTRLGYGSPFGELPLGSDVTREAGQASLLLGDPQAALTELQPLAASGDSVAAGWLAAAYTAEDRLGLARQTLDGVSAKPSAASAFQSAQHLLTLASGGTP